MTENGRNTTTHFKYIFCKMKAKRHNTTSFEVLLTVHLSINFVNDQLDAQFFYFIIRLLQSSTCFEQRRVHHQEVKLY